MNGDRDGFSSGKKIHPDYWDEETATADKACPDHQFINSYVTKTKADIERCYNQLAASCKRVKAEMVKEAYMPKSAVQQRTLMEAFKLHNDEFAERVSKKKGSKGTLGRYERLKDKVEVFLKKKYGKGDIALDDIEMALAVNFLHHLTMDDIGDNTAMKYTVVMVYHTIKCRIDNVTHCAGKYERYVHDEAAVIFVLYQVINTVANSYNRKYAEQR